MDDAPISINEKFIQSDWRALRMAGLMSEINRLIAPSGFILVAEVDAASPVMEDRSEEVLAMMVYRSRDGGPIPCE